MPATDEMFTIEPPARTPHGSDGVLGAEEDTTGVDRHDAIPVLDRALLDGNARDDDGGVVDEDVELAVAAGRRSRQQPASPPRSQHPDARRRHHLRPRGSPLRPSCPRRPARRRRQPWRLPSVNFFASAAPCPRPPPLISATLPSSFPMESLPRLLPRLCGTPSPPAHRAVTLPSDQPQRISAVGGDPSLEISALSRD